MKHIYLLLAVVSFAISSCKELVLEDEPANNAQENFDHLWQQIHDRYAFLNYKKLDWESIRAKYQPLVYKGMSNEQLFLVLGNMVNELRDGHSNLVSPFNISIYQPLTLAHKENFYPRPVMNRYLNRFPERLFITGPLHHTIIDTLGIKAGYVRYSSFMSEITEQDIDYVIERMNTAGVNGLILDVRSNGGGSVANIPVLVSRLADKKRKVYTSYIKNGPGANDFSDGEEVHFEPKGKTFTNRIAILTNRECYSATSFFSTAMRVFPYVRLIGDSTGGGLGAPNGGELPNGWTYRFSVTKTISTEKDANGNGWNWEDGVPPHILINIDNALNENDYDPIIERGIQYIITGN